MVVMDATFGGPWVGEFLPKKSSAEALLSVVNRI